ncbi:MAG: nuclear transport factor 2 family protein [Rhodopirellula sp. JB055]|uniref:nuclear transport factor 2 family protein n=1 Tax=Rhodopirellula sp. JB055 TaxID=3342846 RepID=UPI00370A6A0F
MDLESRLREYYAAWSRQDADGVLAFFAPNSTFEDLAFAAEFEGLDQIRSFVDLTYAGSPDFEVHPTQIIVAKKTAAAAWTMQGTHSGDLPGLPATEKAFQVRASSIVNFDDNGQILSIVDYWNPLEFRASVGLA